MEKETEIQLNKNDVYEFRYNAEQGKKMFEPYHCFDGTLIARQINGGNFILQDTYWSGSESRYFTLEDALKYGALKFICNLDDVEPLREGMEAYYDDKDVFHVRMHHGYHSKNYLRKGAERSKNKMMESVKEHIEKEEKEIKYAQNRLERWADTLAKIEAGDLSVYI